MKVVYLFNKVLGDTIQEAQKGKGHDSWLFGMLRLPHNGIQTDFLEIEKYIPKTIARFLRKYILTMHYAHIPLFPLFFRYDIVLTSTAFTCLTLKALFGIKKFKWIVLDFNLLGTLQEEKTLKQKILAWSLHYGADGIVAISEAESEALKERFPHLKDKITFFHEATDTNFFKPQTGVSEKNQIITVGNYGRDFDTVISAMEGIDAQLLIVGKFPHNKISSLPLNVKVVQLSHGEILTAYAESKIAIVSVKTNPFYFDSVGTFALIESMSMGKATIVTQTKSMESYVEDGVTGVFVGAGNSVELRQTLMNLLTHTTQRNTIGVNARQYALKYFDGEIFARKLVHFLRGVI